MAKNSSVKRNVQSASSAARGKASPSARQTPTPARAHDDFSDDEKDRNFVTALARGLDLLRCFTPDDNLLGNQELAAKTGLAKATVSRLTYTLAKLGCLRKQPASGKYQLDVGVLAFGYQMLANVSLRAIAHPYMEELAAYAKCAVAMAGRDRLQMVYLDSAIPTDLARSQATIIMRREVGSYLPIHISSVGRACLAAMPAEEREFLLKHIRERHPENWREIRRSLDRAFQDYADYGYCLSLGEWTRDLNAVAVPLVHKDHGVLAFNCGGPSFQLTRERLEEDIGPRLKHMVSQIQTVSR